MTASKNELNSFEILLSNRLYLPAFGLLYQVNCNKGRKREVGCFFFLPECLNHMAGQESKAGERWRKTSQKGMFRHVDCQVRAIDQTNGRKKINVKKVERDGMIRAK